MRIKHIYISEYKNLKDFSLNFDGDSFIDVFVGKNGTGKSNLFEAILEIFKHLFEDDYEVDFDYILKYELEGNEIVIEWKWAESKWIDESEKEVKKIARVLLPDNILIYYSGHNNKISELVETYENNFKKSLKEANEGDTRKFISIGKEYKALLLSVLLLQPKECKAKEFIENKLGIKTIDNQVKITLKRPFYAKKKGYDIDSVESETRFWKAQGITLEFLDKLSSVKKGELEEKGRVRDEGYIYRDDYEDEYIMYLDIEDFQNKFSGATAQDVFRDFDNLKTIEMLDDISIELELLDGTKIGVDKFSDGQFQSVYIYSIMELFKDRNCITLLDEPDSFLHPEWQFDFLKQIFEITEQQSISNHVLMTSHSAVTLIPHKKRNINLFRFINGDLKCHQVNKSYAIEQLSSKIIRFTENEQILSIIHTINAEDNPILFTEGSTDPIILNIAWNKLYEEPIPFKIIFAFGCVYLRMLLQDERILKELGGNTMFGLFDFDEAYNEWNSIPMDALLEDDPYKGLAKKIKDKNSYAILLPVPQIEIIEKQVIKNKETKETFLNESELEIENLFYGDPKTHEFFKEIPVIGGGTILEFRDKRKTDFAKSIVPTLDKEHFEVFRPMFEFIKSKIELKNKPK